MSETITIKKGTISLPASLRSKWQGSEVIVLPADDALIVKRVNKPLARLSDLADRISTKMSQNDINKEIQAYRQNQ